MLAQEMKELQAELGDYNTVSDDSWTPINIYILR